MVVGDCVVYSIPCHLQCVGFRSFPLVIKTLLVPSRICAETQKHKINLFAYKGFLRRLHALLLLSFICFGKSDFLVNHKKVLNRACAAAN